MSYKNELKFGVPCAVLYEALLSVEKMSCITRNKAEIDPQVGGKFSFYNDRISGTFIELVQDKLIMMQWSIAGWPKNSNVKLVFKTYEDDECNLEVVHEDIPQKEIGVVENTWNEAFWRPFSIILGFPIREGLSKN